MAIGREGNVKWVDGLRGIASVLVVLTHIARAFDGPLFVPADDEKTAPRLLQYPYLRILVQGRVGVTIFGFVTGYVCALKPLKLIGQSQQEAAFNSIAKSALRRFPRLFLPATVATLLCWLLNVLGLFEIAHHSDSWWTHSTSPEAKPGLSWAAVYDLGYWIIGTWTLRRNPYDNNQWTLLPLLTGSFTVYLFVIATAYVQQKWRMAMSLMMFAMYWRCGDAAFGTQFFWGVFICDLQSYAPATAWVSARPQASRILAVLFLFLGLTIASYPEQKPEWQPWSTFLHAVLKPILPDNPDFPRFSSGIGLEFVTLAIYFSAWARDLLSSKHLLWFGKQSFAVYLLHGSMLRIVLAWMLYGIFIPADTMNDKGEMVKTTLSYPGHGWLAICLLAWLPMVYGVASMWTRYVDPWCARITEKFVDMIKLDKNARQVLPSTVSKE